MFYRKHYAPTSGEYLYKKISDTLGDLVCHLFLLNYILTSSVVYYWTDTRQHRIYLLNWLILLFFYFSDRWNKLDVISVVTYLVIIVLRLTTWTTSESVETNRAVLVASYLYSFNTLCLTLRISHVIETFKGLGTIQIALFNILQDVFTIVWQFIAAVFAFSVAITKIYMAEKSFLASASNQQNLWVYQLCFVYSSW